MSDEIKKTIINDVEVIEDGNVTHFIPLPDKKKPEVNHKSTWQKICDWFTSGTITPYFKVRDLSDPFGDKNYEGGSKKSPEIGIRIRF